MVVCFCGELAHWASDNTRKLGVLCKCKYSARRHGLECSPLQCMDILRRALAVHPSHSPNCASRHFLFLHPVYYLLSPSRHNLVSWLSDIVLRLQSSFELLGYPARYPNHQPCLGRSPRYSYFHSWRRGSHSRLSFQVQNQGFQPLWVGEGPYYVAVHGVVFADGVGEYGFAGGAERGHSWPAGHIYSHAEALLRFRGDVRSVRLGVRKHRVRVLCARNGGCCTRSVRVSTVVGVKAMSRLNEHWRR